MSQPLALAALQGSLQFDNHPAPNLQIHNVMSPELTGELTMSLDPLIPNDTFTTQAEKSFEFCVFG